MNHDHNNGWYLYTFHEHMPLKACVQIRFRDNEEIWCTTVWSRTVCLLIRGIFLCFQQVHTASVMYLCVFIPSVSWRGGLKVLYTKFTAISNCAGAPADQNKGLNTEQKGELGCFMDFKLQSSFHPTRRSYKEVTCSFFDLQSDQHRVT